MPQQQLIIMKSNIYDRAGHVYIAKGKEILLDERNIDRFKRLGILEQVLANKEEESQEVIKNEVKRFQEIVKKDIYKYKSINVDLFSQAVKEVQKVIFEGRILHIYPHLATLATYANWYYTHSINVAIISALIAKRMDYSEGYTRDIIIGALLHDIGAIFVPVTVLEKSDDELTEAERIAKEKHCELGVMSISNVYVPPLSKKVIEEHHERLDGSGYPKKLRQNEISDAAKIVAIADAFDTATSFKGKGEVVEIEVMLERICSAPDKYCSIHSAAFKSIFDKI